MQDTTPKLKQSAEVLEGLQSFQICLYFIHLCLLDYIPYVIDVYYQLQY